MKKTATLFGTLVLLSVFLVGCTESEEDLLSGKQTEKEKASQVEVKTKTIQEVKLYVEDWLEGSNSEEVFDSSDSYTFSGFMGEDTLAFERESGYDDEDSLVLIPAKEGHSFTFRELPNIEFEIMEFNREEGYVQLKTVATR